MYSNYNFNVFRFNDLRTQESFISFCVCDIVFIAGTRSYMSSTRSALRVHGGVHSLRARVLCPAFDLHHGENVFYRFTLNNSLSFIVHIQVCRAL